MMEGRLYRIEGNRKEGRLQEGRLLKRRKAIANTCHSPNAVLLLTHSL